MSWSDEREACEDFKFFDDHFPVLAELMKNGRIASIALAKLRSHTTRKDYQVKEPTIVNEIVRDFICSNGLSDTDTDVELRRMVATSALAVCLFSQQDDFKILLPETSNEIAEWSDRMDFFELSTDVEVSALVKNYGLLEPASIRFQGNRGKLISPPLKMSIPQQLVAIFMLGLDLDSFLDPSWFGFELMSTHLVKCAIAASAAVHVNKRPSVQRTLSCLGFTVDNAATSDKVVGAWNSLGDFVPVFSSARSPSPFHSKTRHLNVGLQISKDGNSILLDKHYKTALIDGLQRNPNGTHHYIPAFAAVNYWNSDLCDGFVTFHAQRRDDPHNVEKMSIMIQARDYHESSTLDTERMNEHAAKHNNDVMDICFGKTRLFCVASKREAVMAKGKATKRQYMPFIVEEGLLLSEILPRLQVQRNRKLSEEQHGDWCDKHGNVLGTSQSRKRSRRALMHGSKTCEK